MTNENQSLKIDKNIPCLRKGKNHYWDGMINQMESGDSVLFSNSVSQYEYEAGRFAIRIRVLGFTASCRQCEGGYRVWKLDKKIP